TRFSTWRTARSASGAHTMTCWRWVGAMPPCMRSNTATTPARQQSLLRSPAPPLYPPWQERTMLSPADTQLAARDRRLPGLATALSADAIHALLVDAGWYAPGDRLRGVYARYKPGTNCLVAYEQPGSGAHVCAIAHGDDAAVKLAKAGALAQRTAG